MINTIINKNDDKTNDISTGSTERNEQERILQCVFIRQLRLAF